MFREWYGVSDYAQALNAAGESGDDIILSFSAQDMAVGQFTRWLSQEGDVSIIVEEGLDTRVVTLDVTDQPVRLILDGVARRLGVQITRTGDLYFLGELRSEDRASLVRKVTRLTSEELRRAIEVLLSERGRVETYADGLVVVGDRVEVLSRVSGLLDSIESADIGSWVVQLHLVSIRHGTAREYGIDLVPEGQLSFAALVGTDNSNAGLNGQVLLNALLVADGVEEGIRVVADPTFVVSDGESAKFADGDVVPVPKRAVSPEGTVTTSGFDYVDTGLTVSVGVRDLGSGGGRLQVELELGAISGFVEDAPIVNRQEFETIASVRSGGVYLLGSVDRAENTSRTDGYWKLRHGSGSVARKVQVWARIYQVSNGAVTVDPRPELQASLRDVAHAESGGERP